MARSDLVALTEQDLEAFANRGTVRRASRELAAGKNQCAWNESHTGPMTDIPWWCGTGRNVASVPTRQLILIRFPPG